MGYFSHRNLTPSNYFIILLNDNKYTHHSVYDDRNQTLYNRKISFPVSTYLLPKNWTVSAQVIFLFPFRSPSLHLNEYV